MTSLRGEVWGSQLNFVLITVTDTININDRVVKSEKSRFQITEEIPHCMVGG